MRVCQKHRGPATMTLVNRQDGTEYDFCPVCEAEFASLLYGESELSDSGVEKINEALKEVEHGRKPVLGRPKAVKK